VYKIVSLGLLFISFKIVAFPFKINLLIILLILHTIIALDFIENIAYDIGWNLST
jgi:hypothetical protein